MNTELKAGIRVVTPITDDAGQESFEFGKLVSINSRFAKVELDNGTVITVGKTKVEVAPQPKKSIPELKKEIKKTEQALAKELAKGKTIDRAVDAADDNGHKAVLDPRQYAYNEIRAASGRKSLDNGDVIALSLRGKSLGEAYDITAAALGVDIKSLAKKYAHLNPGMQRMALGNRLRGKK